MLLKIHYIKIKLTKQQAKNCPGGHVLFADNGDHVSCQSNVNQNTLETKTDDTRLCNLRLQRDSSDNCCYGADVYGRFELPLYQIYI